jgi:large subunit ribosomal protein L10
MSKPVKQMEMVALKDHFQDVRDLLILSVQKLASTDEAAFRSTLRKKDIGVRVVKNSLTRKVFDELGIRVPEGTWVGPTALAYGAKGIAELSRAIDAELKAPKTAAKYRDRIKVKGGVVEGEPCTYEQALEMPTREEAIAQIVGMILSPGGNLASILSSPGGQVASQIEKLAEGQESGGESSAAEG